MSHDRPRKVRTARDWIWAPLSLFAWTGSFALMLFATATSALMVPFVAFERTQLGWAAPLMKACLRLTFSRVRVDYHRDYDRTQPSVYAHNHTSMLDAHVAIWAIPAVFCGLENEAHLKVPGYGWLLRMANAIPVPRARGGRYHKIAAAFRDRARRGISVLAFPEAHRTLDGKVRPFRRGVFFAAREAGLPIVPIAARGMYRLLPKGTWLIRPSRLHVRVGPQIATAGLTEAQTEDLAETVWRIVAAWIERGEDICDQEVAAFRQRCAPRAKERASAAPSPGRDAARSGASDPARPEPHLPDPPAMADSG